METAFFWIAWGIISFWALKTFYFSFDKEKLNKLRQTAFAINLSVLILFFLPWIPAIFEGEKLGWNQTGWDLILQGNLLVILLGILIAGSAFAFLGNNKFWFKAGAVSHLTSSVLFILTMMSLMPGTFKLSLQSVAPIVASMLLLAGNVVILLLWQQMQLAQKKRR